MLAQALDRGAAQARKTLHPLDKARQIKELTSAAAQVHGWQQGDGEQQVTAIQINVECG
jgi:hypothetical protein